MIWLGETIEIFVLTRLCTKDNADKIKVNKCHNASLEWLEVGETEFVTVLRVYMIN